MATPEFTMYLKWLFYTFLGIIADGLDLVLTPLVLNQSRPQRSVAPWDVNQLSDEALLELIARAPEIVPDSGVRRLTPNTVAKWSQDVGRSVVDAAEANALDLLFAETTIPVPRVRRVVKSVDLFCIIMDYIPGPTLAQIWPTLSTWRKISIAFTLRRYVRQLRRLKAPATAPPGPISAQGPRLCESPAFGAVRPYRGPFASYSELSRFFNDRLKMSAEHRKLTVPPGDPRVDQALPTEHFDDSEPLVLTHQDLNLRNVIVGEDGRLWIIDWAWAGYYPVWFEYITMRVQNKFENISGTDDKFWQALIPFITGPYFRQEWWWRRMAWTLYFR